MKWLLYFIVPLVAVTALALTPRERTLVLHAQSELEAAIAHGVALEAAVVLAQNTAAAASASAIAATDSANVATTKIKTAEDQTKLEHAELARCAGENADMRVLVAKVTGPWWFPGGRALMYGLQKSLISLFVIIGVLIVVGILIKLFVPWAAPAFAFAGTATRWVGALFRRTTGLTK